MKTEDFDRLEQLRADSAKNIEQNDPNNISYLENVIRYMTLTKSELIWIDQVEEHGDEEFKEEWFDEEEFEARKEKANNDYAFANDWIKEEIQKRDLALTKEMLSLLKMEAQEQYNAIKSPMYAPPSKRASMSEKEISECVNKREAYAKTLCIDRALSFARNFESGNQGKK